MHGNYASLSVLLHLERSPQRANPEGVEILLFFSIIILITKSLQATKKKVLQRIPVGVLESGGFGSPPEAQDTGVTP